MSAKELGEVLAARANAAQSEEPLSTAGTREEIDIARRVYERAAIALARAEEAYDAALGFPDQG